MGPGDGGYSTPFTSWGWGGVEVSSIVVIVPLHHLLYSYVVRFGMCRKLLKKVRTATIQISAEVLMKSEDSSAVRMSRCGPHIFAPISLDKAEMKPGRDSRLRLTDFKARTKLAMTGHRCILNFLLFFLNEVAVVGSGLWKRIFVMVQS